MHGSPLLDLNLPFPVSRALSICISQSAAAVAAIAAAISDLMSVHGLIPSFKVEVADYVFEAKTIQRMELLVLSSLFHLADVTCLSLAAKVEETHVPLFINLQQVEEVDYVFEAKTIQRMELLVLSSLKWKMNPPVTPLSFVEKRMRRFGLKNQQHWEFLSRCESLLLSILDDAIIYDCNLQK